MAVAAARRFLRIAQELVDHPRCIFLIRMIRKELEKAATRTPEVGRVARILAEFERKRAGQLLTGKKGEVVKAVSQFGQKVLSKTKMSFGRNTLTRRLGDEDVKNLIIMAGFRGGSGKKMPRGNLRGALREMTLPMLKATKEIVDAAGKKWRALAGQVATYYSPPRLAGEGWGKQLPGVAAKGALGDNFLVSTLNPSASVPATALAKLGWNHQTPPKLVIHGIFESKSFSNAKELAEQFDKTLQRILVEGIELEGRYYAPSEILMDIPTQSKSMITRLIAVSPLSDLPANVVRESAERSYGITHIVHPFDDAVVDSLLKPLYDAFGL